MDKCKNRLFGESSVQCIDNDVKLDRNIITDGEVSGRRAIMKSELHELSGQNTNNGITINTVALPSDDLCRETAKFNSMISCDPCRKEGTVVAAERYCQNCDENLCKTCVRFHRKFSATATHLLRKMNEDFTNDIPPVAESHSGNHKCIDKIRLFDMIPTHCIDVNVKTADDKNDCNITGCELLSSGNIVLCDNQNSALKIVDMTYHRIIGRQSLPSNPWDVTVTEDQLVAVSVPFDKTILLFSISNTKITCIRSLKVDGVCLGLENFNDHFIVSYASKIEIISIHGTVKKVFNIKLENKPHNVADPWYVAFSSVHNCVYVSYRDSNEISRLLINQDQHIRRLRDEDISYPAGICVANGSELVVCNWDIHAIQLYGSGKKLLLDEGDGLKHPQAVCYSDEHKKLFVSSYWYDGDPKYLNNIKVFNLCIWL